ncbi:hypothetical protein DFJ67_6657 [Asanoa ferruginea]|uniref:Uncharacterized protein n=1 Tax=Asanoa ferruginea TaxID=53367 RepID=A0A3D9ZTM4_9ACTN|nr:hypothetical protein DFJ67_6657 [Asanoa ferruginea]
MIFKLFVCLALAFILIGMAGLYVRRSRDR